MSDFDDSIAIVFPTDWPTEDLVEDSDPHCTLLWLGNISDASFTKEDVQSVLDRLRIDSPGSIATTGLELFGPDEDVLVVTLEKADELEDIRERMERTLAKIGAGNASEYKDYKPHVTIAYDFGGRLEDADISVDLPQEIKLFEPVLWWGDER